MATRAITASTTTVGWEHSDLEPLDILGFVRRHLRTLSLLVLLAAAGVESILIFRLWAQLSDITVGGGMQGWLYGLSNSLVSPFASTQPTPIHDTGILDFSTLVAIEVYLVATLVALFVLSFTGLILRFVHFLISRHERHMHAANATVDEQEPLLHLPTRVHPSA